MWARDSSRRARRSSGMNPNMLHRTAAGSGADCMSVVTRCCACGNSGDTIRRTGDLWCGSVMAGEEMTVGAFSALRSLESVPSIRYF